MGRHRFPGDDYRRTEGRHRADGSKQGTSRTTNDAFVIRRLARLAESAAPHA